jgi:DNA primase
VLGDEMPKYLNSPESPIFRKRRLFYGLNLTRQHCRHEKLAYVVEGYSDLISLYQAGVKNTVATLGTALTEDHVRLLKGFPEKVIVVFDGDTAGAKAALRSGPLFINQGLEFKIFALPEGYDPDTYINEVGPEAFKENAAWGVGLIEFALDCALREHGQSLSGKVKVVNDVGPLLAAVDDPVAKALFIKMVAEKIGVDESAVAEHARQAAGGRTQASSRPRFNASPHPNGSLQFNKLEVQLLTMMIQYPLSIPLVKERGVVDFFTSSVIEQIARHVIEVYETEDFNIARLIETTDDAKEREIISSLAMKEERWNHEGCLRLIDQFDAGQSRKTDDLFDAIKAAEASGDQHKVNRLLQQLGREALKMRSDNDKNETIH